LGPREEHPASAVLLRYLEVLDAYANSDRVPVPLQASYREATQKALWAARLLAAGRWRGLYGVLEWPTKRVLVDEYLAKKGRTWAVAVGDPVLWKRVRDLCMLNFSALDDDVSIYARLAKAGRIQEVVRPSEVIRAVSHPPAGRALQRVQVASTYHPHLADVSWERVTFKQPEGKVVVLLDRPTGAEQEFLDHALAVCETPMDFADFIARVHTNGLSSTIETS
jgi:hypothetical protein